MAGVSISLPLAAGFGMPALVLIRVMSCARRPLKVKTQSAIAVVAEVQRQQVAGGLLQPDQLGRVGRACPGWRAWRRSP